MNRYQKIMDKTLFNHYTFQSGEIMVNIKKIDVFIFFILLLLSFIPANGQSIFEQIHWKGADTSIIIGLILTLIVGIGILIFLNVRANAQQKYEVEKLAFQTFQKNVEKTELTEIEASKIKAMLRYANITHPHIIFQSASLFEKCMDAEITSLLQKNISQDDQNVEEEILFSLRKKMGFGFLPYEHPLISTRNIEVGQKVSIIDRRNKTPLIQNARVVLNREFFFRVQYDPEKEENLGVLEGQPVMLAFARQSDGVYGVQVVICGKDQSIVDLRHTLELNRNQLRQYARVDINIPVKLRLIKTASDDDDKPVKSILLEGRMVDISGGGGCIILDKSLIPGDIVSLNFKISDNGLNGIAAKILRVSLQEIHDTTFYRHSLQFINIEHVIREKIIKFVFEKQRQLNQWR